MESNWTLRWIRISSFGRTKEIWESEFRPLISQIRLQEKLLEMLSWIGPLIENDIERELEKTCTPDLFRNQLRMLSSMKDDYQVIKMVIATLSFKDCETLNAYFDYQKQHIKFGTVAEEKEILVSSIYQKFWRVKSKVKKNAIDKFDRKYGRITAGEHVRELN